MTTPSMRKVTNDKDSGGGGGMARQRSSLNMGYPKINATYTYNQVTQISWL